MSIQPNSADPEEVQLDSRHQTAIEDAKAPPYRRWPYEVEREERRVSPEPEQLHCQRDSSWREDGCELRPSATREFEAQDDHFDHHHGRSTAATYFHPSDVDDLGTRKKFERLKGWNDGTRDTDRQTQEGHADKGLWVESYGAQLELPYDTIKEAKRLLDDLSDIRRLGHYNSLHTAVLAALTEAYRRHWLRQQYRCDCHDQQETWRERDDFRRLWTSLDLSEDDLYSAVLLLDKKTEV